MGARGPRVLAPLPSIAPECASRPSRPVASTGPASCALALLMAIRVTRWLEDTFATQLLLGDEWLHEKNSKKPDGIKSELVKAYRGLYHDNGSCLDITNEIPPEQQGYLQIIQACDRT